MIEALEARLARIGCSTLRMKLACGATALVSEYGGRLYGPVFSDGKSACWIPECMREDGPFLDCIASGAWNIGGERLWLAPELKFNVRDKKRFDESYDLPREIDPGEYILARSANGADLSADMRFEARETGERKSIRIRREYRPCPNPLRERDALMDGVLYAGYSHEITLEDDDKDAAVEPWTLTQLAAPGRMIVELRPGWIYADYYAPVGENLESAERAARLNVTGRHVYKVGFRAEDCTGRLGYTYFQDGECILSVREFYSQASNAYTKEPADRPGVRGFSAHVYADDGRNGSFTELETSGRSTAHGRCADMQYMWTFKGEPGKVAGIAEVLLGVS